MSCGYSHLLVLTIDGEVYGWGYNSWGQIGNRKTGLESQLTPYFVNEFNGEKVKSISCGYEHSLALTQRGRVYSWGFFHFGQLGRNNGENSCPKPIEITEEIIISKISCGKSHSLLLSGVGEVYVFGMGCKKLDIKKNSQRFTEIASHWSQEFSCALSINGLYYVWGKVSDISVIQEPNETKFKSFNEIFIHYFEITYEIIEGKLIEFNDKFIRNGFFKNEFIEPEFIGKGSFGKVFKVKKGYSDFAVKKLDYSLCHSDFNKELVSKELENFSVIKELKNEKVVKYFDLWFEGESSQNYQVDSSVFIKMELCDKTLHELMQEIKNDRILLNDNCSTSLDYYISTQIFIQILDGVNFLHTRNPQIIHRDLNPNNILIKINNKNGNSVVKIADMGLLCLHNNYDKHIELNANLKQYHTQDIGAITYAAPEVLDSRIYDTKSDIYSLGIILNQFIIDRFSEYNQSKMNSQLISKLNELNKLYQRMIKENSRLRPNCEEILNNGYLWTLNRNELNLNKEMKEFFDICAGESNDIYIFQLINKLLAPTIHHNLMCDECREFPIIGIRYKCNDCEDYDLCQSCIKLEIHQLHIFSEITFYSSYI